MPSGGASPHCSLLSLALTLRSAPATGDGTPSKLHRFFVREVELADALARVVESDSYFGAFPFFNLLSRLIRHKNRLLRHLVSFRGPAENQSRSSRTSEPYCNTVMDSFKVVTIAMLARRA